MSQAGPAGAPLAARTAQVPARLSRAGVDAIRSGKVMTADEASWLFYADHGPSLAFEHPGRIVLVGQESGKVRVSQRLRWVPLINGRLPAFFKSPERYASKDYRVFDRPWKVRAEAAKAKARAAATTPETAAARQRLADALAAAERSCALRVSDTLGDFYDYGNVDETRASLGRVLRDLGRLNAGFVSQRYTARAGRTPTQTAQGLIDDGCRDSLPVRLGQRHDPRPGRRRRGHQAARKRARSSGTRSRPPRSSASSARTATSPSSSSSTRPTRAASPRG